MLSKDQRANYGRLALNAGTPDRGDNGNDAAGLRTDAADTIANILHTLELGGVADPVDVLTSARNYYEAENVEDRERGADL